MASKNAIGSVVRHGYPEDRMTDYLTYLNEKQMRLKMRRCPSVERSKYINDIVSIINIEKEKMVIILLKYHLLFSDKDPLNARPLLMLI